MLFSFFQYTSPRFLQQLSLELVDDKSWIGRAIWFMHSSPSLPFEKFFPLIQVTDLHKEIATSPQFLDFHAQYGDFIRSKRREMRDPKRSLWTSKPMLNPCQFVNITSRPNTILYATRRAEPLSIFNHLLNTEAFALADRFVRFVKPGFHCNVIPTSRVNVYYTLASYSRANSESLTASMLCLPMTLNASQNQCVLIGSPDDFERLRSWTLVECLSTTQTPKITLLNVHQFIQEALLSPHSTVAFQSVRAFYFLICRSRAGQCNLISPQHKGFELYKHIKTVLKLFDLCKEISKYDSKKMFEKGSATTLSNKKPHVLRGVRSFLELALPHSTSFQFVQELHSYLLQHADLQQDFAQVWDCVSFIMKTTDRSATTRTTVIELGDNYTLTDSGDELPIHFYLYGMALSPKVSRRIKRNIVLKLYTPAGVQLTFDHISAFKPEPDLSMSLTNFIRIIEEMRYGNVREPYEDCLVLKQKSKRLTLGRSLLLNNARETFKALCGRRAYFLDELALMSI